MDREIGQFQIINNCEAKGNEKKKEMYQSFMNLSAFSFVLYPWLEPSMNINTSKVLTLYKMGTKLTLSKWECDKRIFSHLVIFFHSPLPCK